MKIDKEYFDIKIDREYKLKDTLTPNKEQIQKAEEIFRKYNLPLYKERS